MGPVEIIVGEVLAAGVVLVLGALRFVNVLDKRQREDDPLVRQRAVLERSRLEWLRSLCQAKSLREKMDITKELEAIDRQLLAIEKSDTDELEPSRLADKATRESP